MKAIKIKHNRLDKISKWYPYKLKNGNIDLHVITFINGYYQAGCSYEIEITEADLEQNLKTLEKFDVSVEYYSC